MDALPFPPLNRKRTLYRAQRLARQMDRDYANGKDWPERDRMLLKAYWAHLDYLDGVRPSPWDAAA